ncbi:MAG TPA: MFS transporter [Candidatus Absconditabacterales bacterium]|nr:MFS transporter [Candidatus Absconditabacterales bacterium]
MQNKIQQNIWKMYFIKATRMFLLIMPIVVLFFQDNGLSMTQIFLLNSIFSISIVLFEIPSGYFSDVMGRKKCLIIATILGTLGILGHSLSYGFWGFMFAEIIMALSLGFFSGTDSAIIYDTLLSNGKEGEYKKIEGRMEATGNFSEAIAGIIGGLLATISLRTPFYVETILSIPAIFIVISIIEPPIEKNKNKDGPIKNISKIVRYSLHGNKEIKRLIFYFGFFSASTLTFVWLVQPYFNLVGLPLKYFGFAWAILNASVGFFALQAHKFESFFGRKKSLISLILLVFIGYILLSIFQSIWAILFMFLFYFARGIGRPIIKDYINKIISSKIRATVLSIQGLVGRLFFAIISPFIGWIMDIYTLQYAMIGAGIVFLTFSVICLIFMRRHRLL